MLAIIQKCLYGLGIPRMHSHFNEAAFFLVMAEGRFSTQKAYHA
jgi:hypothetical protein